MELEYKIPRNIRDLLEYNSVRKSSNVPKCVTISFNHHSMYYIFEQVAIAASQIWGITLCTTTNTNPSMQGFDSSKATSANPAMQGSICTSVQVVRHMLPLLFSNKILKTWLASAGVQAAYWSMLEEGRITQTAALLLMQSVDEALDQVLAHSKDMYSTMYTYTCSQ